MSWYVSTYAETALVWLHWAHEQLGIYLDIGLAVMIVVPAIVFLFAYLGGGSTPAQPDPEGPDTE